MCMICSLSKMIVVCELLDRREAFQKLMYLSVLDEMMMMMMMMMVMIKMMMIKMMMNKAFLIL